MKRMRRFARVSPIEKARKGYGLDGSEGARVCLAIQDRSLFRKRHCNASCKEKVKVIDPPVMSSCSLECGAKGGFLGCRWPGLSISIDRHDVAMRELVRLIEYNP